MIQTKKKKPPKIDKEEHQTQRYFWIASHVLAGQTCTKNVDPEGTYTAAVADLCGMNEYYYPPSSSNNEFLPPEPTAQKAIIEEVEARGKPAYKWLQLRVVAGELPR